MEYSLMTSTPRPPPRAQQSGFGENGLAVHFLAHYADRSSGGKCLGGLKYSELRNTKCLRAIPPSPPEHIDKLTQFVVV